jgi:histidyl-tRNA synthetase
MIRNTLRLLCGNKIVIRLNHRGLFNRFLSSLGVMESSVEILRQVDKLAKVGKDGIQELLEEITGKTESIGILDYVTLGAAGDFDGTLEAIKNAAGEGEDTRRLEELRSFMKDAGAADSFILDTSITRGLDYYTGVVYETFLTGLPEIGSVCSGGRYDNLAGLYSKEPVCGVGSSIGLDRLQTALEILEVDHNNTASGHAALACLEAGDAGKAQKAAELFRQKGINCEVFLEPKKLTQQFILAEKKGIPWMIIPESGYSRFTLRNIALREDKEGLDFEGSLRLIKSSE